MPKKITVNLHLLLRVKLLKQGKKLEKLEILERPERLEKLEKEEKLGQMVKELLLLIKVLTIRRMVLIGEHMNHSVT